MEKQKKEYRCVHCGHGIDTLFVQYSPGNIRLMKCENCKVVADEYIECELMILLIDLILHKRQAYIHLLHNVLKRDTLNFEGLLRNSTLGFILLDAYRNLLIRRRNGGWHSSWTFPSLVWNSQKMLVDVFVGNFIFVCTLIAMMRIAMNSSTRALRYKDLLFAIVISSYFKLYLLATVIWEFPSSVVFIIDFFVLSSNTVALKEPFAIITTSAAGD